MKEEENKCLVCERTEATTNIIPHHINYTTDETIPLCAKCHLTCAHPTKLKRMTDVMKRRGIKNHYLYSWLEEAPMLQRVAKDKGVVFHKPD